MLARLVLRSIEVARMQLEDLDWRAGELVVRGKARRRDRLPLPADVGDALARLPLAARQAPLPARVLDRQGADAPDPQLAEKYT